MIWPFGTQHKEEKEAAHIPFSGIEKIGETLTPNMRALRLAMTIGDMMLSMGVPAGRVVSRSLDITETYCKRPVHIDVSSNIIMLSQLRGIDKEPLTLIRPVTARKVNNMTLQRVQQIVDDIHANKYTLDQAEAELDRVLKNPKKYPSWVLTLGNASIAAGVSILFSTNWRIWIVTFGIAILVERLIVLLTHHGITSFFRQIFAAAFVTIAAATINQLARSGVDFFVGMNPTLIVVGGIIMLVAGLMIVGAIQDAIEEYYVTANARILKVVLLTMGIVIGILIGLYIARKFGMNITVSPSPLTLNAIPYQIAGAGILTAGFALGTQTRLRAIIWAAMMGITALLISYWATNSGVSIIPASGIAAIVIGLLAALFSRRWGTPSTGIIAAGILPLVPGLALMNGLLHLANHPPEDPLFLRGVAILFTAIGVALAIAIGATFGSMLARPLHHKVTNKRNLQPLIAFTRGQFRSSHSNPLDRFAVIRTLEHLWQPKDDKDKTAE
tara:strand:+ start:1363 stop:2862 length:1500 start_codon:yes stop_codon:yes gene_type:complete